MTTRARIVRAEAIGDRATAVSLPQGLSLSQRRLIARERLDGELAAERAMAAAEMKVQDLVATARAEAAAIAKRAEADARAAEHAKLSAQYLALRKAEETRSERDIDRAIALAVALAERLLGASLELEPSRIAGLARQALAEARGARRARIEAHPLDAAALSTSLGSLGLPEGTVEVQAKEGLARGELCLHTDLGTLDAKLTPQLDRLAAALRDALR